MTAHDNNDGDVALRALELAEALRRLAEVVHNTHGRLVAGDLRRAAIIVEETYQHLALGPLAEPRAAPDPPAGPSLDLSYPQPGGSSGGGSPRRRER